MDLAVPQRARRAVPARGTVHDIPTVFDSERREMRGVYERERGRGGGGGAMRKEVESEI